MRLHILHHAAQGQVNRQSREPADEVLGDETS